MPRPTDWDSIGLSADPTPGDPDQINQLAGIFSHLGGKAREIYNAIEIRSKTDSGQDIKVTAEVQQHIGRKQPRTCKREAQ